MDEVVRKKGDLWAYYDDKTGVEKGVFNKRKDAWQRQRLNRASQKAQRKHDKGRANKGKKPTSGKKPGHGIKPSPGKKAPKPHRENKEVLRNEAKKVVLEAIKNKFKNILSEGSALSYVFEQSPDKEDSIYWEKFLDKLSPQTMLGDEKLKKILQNMAQAEVQLLAKAVGAIKRTLSGHFEVAQGDPDQDESGDLILNFGVITGEDNGEEDRGTFKFAVKIDNGRPLIQFPEETTQELNSSPDDNVRQLKAYLMFAQEDQLDKMNDVVDITAERDEYLQSLLQGADEILAEMPPMHLAMLKFLLRSKYKYTK